MRCCVPFCKNTTESVSKSEGTTFHEFPADICCRTAWLKAIGREDSHLADSAFICSQHFLDDDIYETNNGLRLIRVDSIPAAVLVCVMCLNTNSKLISMAKFKLEQAYENLTGYSLNDVGSPRATLCVECAQRLVNFSNLRNKCLRAYLLFQDILNGHEIITIRHKGMINHVKNQLKSKIEKTILEPNDCDLYKSEYPDEDKQADLNVKQAVESIVVKNEGENDFLLDDENHKESSLVVLSGVVKNEVDNDFMLDDDGIIFDTHKFEPNHCDLRISEYSGENIQTDLNIIKQTVESIVVKNEGENDFLLEDENHKESSLEMITVKVDNVDNNINDVACEISVAGTPTANENVTPLTAGLATHNINKLHLTNDGDTNDKSELFKIYKDAIKSKITTTKNIVKQEKRNIRTYSNNCLNNLYDKQKISEIFQRDDLDNQGNTIAKHLNRKSILAKRVTKRSTKSKRNKSFPCNLCEYKCSANSRLMRHMRIHTGEKPYSCNFCEYKCAGNSNLITHMRTHTGEKPYSCNLCEYKCTGNSNLMRHMRTHSGEKPYSCNLCEYKCAENSHLITHMRIHTGEKPYSCNFCEYKCAGNSNLITHMRTHTGEKPYSCNLCEYKCTGNSNLMSHMRTHTGEKPYSCNFCEYKCAENSSLITHMRTHTGEKPYSCNLCEYKCARNTDLITHMRTHTGDKPYSCNLCEYKCAANRHLITHNMRTHMGEKLYSCNLCEHKCTRNSDLITHMRTHTGEKPYSCNVCEYKSAANRHLITHMRTHTGEKPYSCNLCEHKFTRNSDLITHMKKHTGEEPYSCDLCKFKCAAKCTLIKHIRTHTGENP